ncbi:hypothetical protein N8482_00420 [Chitinophagales bacterium]|nr:hypothetical protein [Chitinophagales bacterium]
MNTARPALLALLIYFACSLSLSASSADLFSYDKGALETEMSSLNQLEQLVKAQPGVSAELLAFESNLNVNLASGYGAAADFSIDEMEWDAFAWGFCCWPVGFFLVAINDEASRDEKTSYWIGLIVSAVLGGISAVATAASN